MFNEDNVLLQVGNYAESARFEWKWNWPVEVELASGIGQFKICTFSRLSGINPSFLGFILHNVWFSNNFSLFQLSHLDSLFLWD